MIWTQYLSELSPVVSLTSVLPLRPSFFKYLGTLHVKALALVFFDWKVFPLDTNFLSSFTIFCSDTTWWQFYIKFLPPAFVFSFPSLFFSIANVLPSNKLYVHNLVLLLLFLTYYIFSKNYFTIKVYYFILKKFNLYSFYGKYQVEICVCFLYCHFHSI